MSIGFREYQALVRADLYRIWGHAGWRVFLQQLVWGTAFKYIFWFRTCQYAHGHRNLKLWLYPIAQLWRRHYMLKLGIDIPWKTEIGPGLYIGHFGSLIINANVRIGRNCNLSHGVTIGQSNRGPRKGCPTIGDAVYVGPGAKLLGAITIGDHVAIGANAVVTKDVPDNAVVAGIPAEVISYAGSESYVTHTDYDAATLSNETVRS